MYKCTPGPKARAARKYGRTLLWRPKCTPRCLLSEDVTTVSSFVMPRKGKSPAAALLVELAEEHPEEARALVHEILNQCDHNRSAAAYKLGVSRSTFYKIVKALRVRLVPSGQDIRPSRAALIAVLNLNRGNKSATARMLGVCRQSIERWCEAYDLNAICHRDVWKNPVPLDLFTPVQERKK